MDFSECTCLSSAPSGQAGDLTNDYMFGFNVEDIEDRKYLAEVAMRRMGPEQDINHFARLSLLRGADEWEQAMHCALAMQKRASIHDPLGMQDVLTFQAKIYGVDELSRATSGLSSPQIPERLRKKRKHKKPRTSRHAEISLGKRAKKLRKIGNSRESPYWAETPAPEQQEDVQPREDLEEKTTPKQARENLKRSSESADLAESTVQMEGAEDGAVSQACTAPELGSCAADGQDGSVESAPSIDARKDKRKPGHDVNAALPGPDVILRDFYWLDSNTDALENAGEENNSSTDKASDTEAEPPPQKETLKRKAKSPYFEITTTPSPVKLKSPRPPRGTVSSLSFPRLDAPRFGLIQEELADDPFRLLIAVTFLIRTSGKSAIPVFRALIAKYPTPKALAEADTGDIVAMIQHLGLGAVRAAMIQRYARIWLTDPPRSGIQYAVRNYPLPRAGAEGSDTVITSEDTRTSAWEIGHMTQGPYALDSWRIFCRDVLRGAAEDWKGKGRDGKFQPEWMRVRPRDKELRACLRWMWMQEGWLWDPATGAKVVLPDALRRAVQEGRVGYDDTGDLRILDEAVG